MGSKASVVPPNTEAVPTGGTWVEKAIRTNSVIHDIRGDKPNDDGSPCLEKIEQEDKVVVIKCSPVFKNATTCILFGNSIAGGTDETLFSCHMKTMEEITKEIACKSPKYGDSFTVIYDKGEINQYNVVRLSKGERAIMVWIEVAKNLPKGDMIVTECPALLKLSNIRERVDILLCNGVWAEWIKQRRVYIALPKDK